MIFKYFQGFLDNDVFTVVYTHWIFKMTGYEVAYEMLESSKEWSYRGEGNCNIVISLPKSKQILRIRKIEKPKSILGWILVLISDFFYWYYGKGFRDEIRDINFYSKVMRPLLGNKYTSESKQVILSRKQMQIYKDGIMRKRPESRLNKTLQYGRAALFNDFAFLPMEFDHLQFADDTFSVEIKPKQGWRPPKEQVYSQCFFCMHQYLKLEKNQIKCRTKYCPEELFSGDKQRMKRALKDLLEVPQNNFKVFKNGVFCNDDKLGMSKILQEIFESDECEEMLKEEFCDFLQRCLVKDLGNINSEVSNTKCKNYCSSNMYNKLSINNLEHKLPQGAVLERILSVQMLDHEGTHSTYKKFSQSDILCEDFSFVEKLLEILDCDENACVRCTILDSPKKYKNELMFLPYLVSAIAKDCSLMITFRKLRENPCDDSIMNNTFETKFGTFLVNIGVFDLYPKPLSTIQKHHKRNRDIGKALKKSELLT